MRTASRIYLVAAIAGCNALYGNDPVARIDAAYFDAPLDAPFTCPTGALPSFSRQFRQLIAQDCTPYEPSASARRAVTQCLDTHSDLIAHIGDLDAPLAPEPALASTTGNPVQGIRLSPDGAHVTYLEYRTAIAQYAAISFHFAAEGWVRDPDIAVAPTIASISEPTAGPHPRMLVVFGLTDVRELADDGNGAWTEAGRDRLDFSNLSNLHLSSDGLRAWASTGAQIVMFARTDLEAAFTLLGNVPGTNGLGDAFITDDCSGLYFSTLASIWFAPRS